METATIKEIARHDGSEVILKCWLSNKRSSGKILFLTLRDGTGYILAPFHNLQIVTPVENILTMYRTVRDLRR